MTVGKRRFRPMGLGEIIDEAFDLYKSNFVLLVGIAAVFYVPINLLNAPSMGSTLTTFSGAFKHVGDLQTFSSAIGRGGGMKTTDLVVFLLMFLGYPIVIGAFTRAIGRRYLGEDASIAESYSHVWRRFGACLVTTIIFDAILFAGYVAFAIVAGICAGGAALASVGGPVTLGAGIVVAAVVVLAALLAFGLIMCRMLLMFPVLIAEGRAYFECLARAWNLSSGQAWRVFGIVLLSVIVLGLIQFIAVGPFWVLGVWMAGSGGAIVGGILLSLVTAIVSVLLAPVLTIIVILVYYDLRIRKEGFDLEVMARELVMSNTRGAVGTSAGVAANQVTYHCAHCRYPIYRIEDGVACPSCGAALHLSCWQQNGGCSTPGCAANHTAGSQQT